MIPTSHRIDRVDRTVAPVLFGCLLVAVFFLSPVAESAALDLRLATAVDVATRHVRRGADLPTDNQGVAAVLLGASESTTGLYMELSGRTVLADRGSPFRTKDLDEMMARTGWQRMLSLLSRPVSLRIGVDAYLYPRRINAGYGALVLEPTLRITLPAWRIRPHFSLAVDTTQLQVGAYWEIGAVTTPAVGRTDLEIGAALGWVEGYLKQDTPDLVSTTQAAGIIGLLAALAPAVADVTVALPLEPIPDSPTVRLTPYIRGVLVSPFVQSINEDGGEIVLGMRAELSFAPSTADRP